MRILYLAIALMPLISASVSHAQVPIPRPIKQTSNTISKLEIPGLGKVNAILTREDVDLYQTLFAFQEEGRWEASETIAKHVSDERLMGYVLAQKYLHPTKYRSKYHELKEWLKNYSDNLNARRIYRLANKRRPKGAKPPKKPIVFGLKPQVYNSPALKKRIAQPRSAEGRRIISIIKSRISKGWPTGALELLDKPDSIKKLTKHQTAEMLQNISRAYFRAGKDTKAQITAKRAVKMSPDRVAIAHWWGGLAAWRSKNFDEASYHFTSLTRSKNISSWLLSAAAFWSARASLINERPERVIKMLEIGSKHDFTFYGILSKRTLGKQLEVNWKHSLPTSLGYNKISKTDYGGRAIALLQVGLQREAESELLSLAATKPGLQDHILSLANTLNLPALSIKLASKTDSGNRNAALYPIPKWNFDGNFLIDRALIYAFIRQESAFNERAYSKAGARGLMQLMPQTASFVAGQRGLSRNKKYKLFNPELNISLGQRYIALLSNDKSIPNDLFRLATAYNAGPGNLRNWQAKVNYNDDPLMYIESIPSRETRLFIERVMTNLWLYRNRLGQKTPSLDDVAEGIWPKYAKLDKE
ncbi:MAG: Soluble lytic murein transglycosylase [Alphaproteobacteria bacterium MarineAlpha12_Bin1]|jgi:soluble lytic murein transglycosylase|nr:MAG: Soluble lytic murein transglycosylase [Alphaproteobacteria bacterium MarineAlpha12_Bin1]